MLVLETLAVLFAPIVLGGVAGFGLRLARRRRIGGIIAMILCLTLPTLLATAAIIRFPVVGIWDAVTEGFLFGAGIVITAHRAFSDPRNVLLTAASVAVAFLLVEVGVRFSLPNAPAYPTGGEGPYFLLANVLRTTAPDASTFQIGGLPAFVEKQAMQGDIRGARMADRPPVAMVTKEIVCSIVYGSSYAGVIDVSYEREPVFPAHLTPRAEASRRVLHIGDSMVFGANVPRGQTFTTHLGELEPDVQHFNGGISGMAPDDYLAVLRRWIERVPVDLAVMYLFAGNDMVGLDAPHPCSNWESLLVYEHGHARLRYPDAPRNEQGIGLRWLVINSPLPYLGRVLIVAHSATAAYLGALLDARAAHATRSGPDTKLQHLEAILQSARDDLAAKRIQFVVVVLPAAGAIDIPNGPSDSLSRDAGAITAKLGVPMLDATDTIRAALARGEHPIQGDQVHFNEEGHRLMAKWLHENLAASAGFTSGQAHAAD